MLFRSVAKCSAYGTNAMHCTSKHRLVIPQRHLPGKSLKPFSSPPMRRAIFLYPEGGKPVNEPMTFLDFFSGVGGFRKALNFAAWSVKAIARLTNSQTAVTAPYTIYRRRMVWRRYYQNRTQPPAEGQPMGRRIPVSGYFCIWPAKRACRKTKLSLF